MIGGGGWNRGEVASLISDSIEEMKHRRNGGGVLNEGGGSTDRRVFTNGGDAINGDLNRGGVLNDGGG